MPPRVSKGVRLTPPSKPSKDIFTPTIDPTPMEVVPAPSPAVSSFVIQLLVALNLLAVFGFYVVYYRIDQQSQAIQRLTSLITSMSLTVPVGQVEPIVQPPTSTPPEVTLPIVVTPTTTEPVVAATTTWMTYAGANFTLRYPFGFTVTPPTVSEKWTAVDGGAGRLEIFQKKDFGGDRPFGGGDGTTVSDAVMNFATVTTTKGIVYDIWFFYPKSDQSLKLTLEQIIKTIR